MSRKTSIRSRPAVSSRILLAAVLLAAGCATERPPAEPDYSAVRSAVKTVALAPLESWVPGVRPEQVEAAYERRAVARLVDAGQTVVEPEVWKAIWRRHAEDVGGIYDPSTGKSDEQKLETVREAVIRELVETRKIDAILQLDLRRSEIYALGQVPTVCGRVIHPYWPEGWRNRGLGQAPTTLARFSCLVGELSDLGGKVLFTRASGIEGIETYDEQTRAVRPADQMLRDEVLLDQTLETVLYPFTPPTPAPGTAPEPKP